MRARSRNDETQQLTKRTRPLTIAPSVSHKAGFPHWGVNLLSNKVAVWPVDCKSEGEAVPDPACSLVGRVVALGFTVLSVMLTACSAAPSSPRDTTVAQYDPESGRLKRIEFDTTHNGRNDAVGIMDGTHVERIEVDEDEDGIIDRWEFYNADRRLERVGFSRQHNGVMDSIAFFAKDGAMERIEMSTRGDGHFNRTEYYQSESLARVEEDTNGDGRTDKWETYAVDAHAPAGQSPSIVMASFDDAFRGTPNRRFLYSPQGTVLRVEVDPDGDGTFVEAAATRRQ